MWLPNCDGVRPFPLLGARELALLGRESLRNPPLKLRLCSNRGAQIWRARKNLPKRARSFCNGSAAELQLGRTPDASQCLAYFPILLFLHRECNEPHFLGAVLHSERQKQNSQNFRARCKMDSSAFCGVVARQVDDFGSKAN